jgi:hypothetical protein
MTDEGGISSSPVTEGHECFIEFLVKMAKLFLEDTTPFPRLCLGKAALKRNGNSKHKNKLQNIDKILSILRR